MKNITVLVSGSGTNLKVLIDSIKEKKIRNGRINLVISSKKDAKALDIAKKENIKTIAISKKDFKSDEEYQEEMFKSLKKENPDLIVLAGFLYILSEKIVKYFKNKIVNIHPSLIPSFCGNGMYGLNVHKAVLEKGVKITGATVHFVNEKADEGPIILQKCIKVKQTDTPEILQTRVKEEAEWKILKKAVNLICLDKVEVINNKTYIKT